MRSIVPPTIDMHIVIAKKFIKNTAFKFKLIDGR